MAGYSCNYAPRLLAFEEQKRITRRLLASPPFFIKMYQNLIKKLCQKLCQKNRYSIVK